MTSPFKPRQKKPVKAVVKTKLVRIDFRTQIEVPVSIPDDVAREKYLSRLNIAIKPCYIPSTPNYPVKEEFKDIPIEEIEELQELAEEVQAETKEE
jgi:hypothetical protein